MHVFTVKKNIFHSVKPKIIYLHILTLYKGLAVTVPCRRLKVLLIFYFKIAFHALEGGAKQYPFPKVKYGGDRNIKLVCLHQVREAGQS